MAHIDYFFSMASPYVYLAGTRLGEIAERHGATVAYKPLDVLALFQRTGGTAPGERHESRKAYRLQELQTAGAEGGSADQPASEALAGQSRALLLCRDRCQDAPVAATSGRWCIRLAVPAGPRSSTSRTRR